MPPWLTQLYNELVCVGRAVLQSDLTPTILIAILTAFAGAFAGAYGAQRIAERARSKEELIKEIRNTNAGISVAFSIFNSFFGLKKQHVAALKNNFDAQKAGFENAEKQRQKGEGVGEVFVFHADLQTLQPLIAPIERMQAIVFEKISVTGRPLNLASILMQTIHSLNDSIEKRNELIQSFRAAYPRAGNEFIRLYFGFADKNGHVDANYPMGIEAIYKQTDDCIYFSKMLAEDLMVHGKSLKRNYEYKFRGKTPNIGRVDFTVVKDQGLMPPPENYPDWTDAFKKKEP